MSNKSANITNKEKNELIENNPFFNICQNHLMNNIDKNNIKDNIISKSFNESKNKNEINIQKKISFPKNLNIEEKENQQPNNIILLLYKELIKDLNDLDDYYAQNINIINDKDCSFETVVNIFKKTFIKILDEKSKLFMENIEQYKSKILFLEQSNRFYIQQIFLKQTKIDILKNEREIYMEMEEEFEEMKEKLKYENGKFLNNEKKENEILILRAENSNLKKAIDKNEKTIEEKDLLIESIKKKSASIIVTNKNTMKNSFDQPSASPSPLNFIKPNHKSNQIKQRQNLSHISSNITNFKKINNNYNYETNNNFNSKKNIQIKNISCGDTTNYLNSKKNSLINTKINTKELLGKKIKNKVLNMKKIRRINDSFLNNYSKSYAHINNSIMSNSSNNSNSKRIRKSINSFLKKNKNELSDRIKYVQKKLSSGMNNSIFHKNDNKNIKNLIKNNSNRIIVNSILNNNNVNSMSKIHNKSFLMKTSDKKFYMIKNNNKTKTNLKQYNDKLLFERNNYSFLKCNNTFNTNDFDNSIRMKNNIIINNIIQNSPDIPPTILGSKEKNNDKVKIS